MVNEEDDEETNDILAEIEKRDIQKIMRKTQNKENSEI